MYTCTGPCERQVFVRVRQVGVTPALDSHMRVGVARLQGGYLLAALGALFGKKGIEIGNQ